MSERPFTDFGQFGEGQIDLRVFNQDEYWVDVMGTGYALVDMDDDYRRNVIIFLLSLADDFHSRVHFSTLIASYSEDNDYPPMSPDPTEWLEGTPLMKRLRALTPDAPTVNPILGFSLD